MEDRAEEPSPSRPISSIRGRLTNQLLLIFSSSRGLQTWEHFQLSLWKLVSREEPKRNGPGLLSFRLSIRFSLTARKCKAHKKFELAATAAKSSQPPIY